MMCLLCRTYRAGYTLQQPFKPENVIADAAFGTEQNYELWRQKRWGGYLKFPTFHAEQTKKYQNDPFL